MKTWIFCIANVCLFAVVSSSAQNTNPAFVRRRLETVANSYAKGDAFMGSVLVVKGDRTLLKKSYGMADLEWNIPDAPDVKFRLCSVSKEFTAALVLLLQQDGKLNIADPLGRYLPNIPRSWQKITLAELLGHTSGIPDIINDKEFGTWSMSPHSPEEQLAVLRDKPLEFEPGSQFRYSNSNYILLGMVLEKVSGQKYSVLLRQGILIPLGMRDTGLDTDELVLPKRAQGYNLGRNGLVSARRSLSMTVPWAAGAIYSTTGDLLRWERALFGGKVLNQASLKAMTSPGKGGYGLGVEVARIQGLKVIEHGGGLPGFTAEVAYVPQRKIAVIVLSNVYGPATASMGEQLLNVAMGKKVILASERKPVSIAKSELGRFVGVYDVSPAFAITISIGGDSLMAQGNTQARPMPLMYQGVVNGHPYFYIPKLDAELEFVTDEAGKVNSLILHQGGDHLAKKR